MRRTLPWLALLIVVLVAGALFWTRRHLGAGGDAPGAAGTAESTPAAETPPTLVAEPVGTDPTAANPAAGNPAAPGPAPTGASGKVMAPPGPAARLPPGERLDGLTPTAPSDGRIGGRKGELFDPLNSGLRRP